MTRLLTRHVTSLTLRDVRVADDLTLGKRIRAARKRAGLSHDRLGAQVGTSRQHLIRLEKDLHTPRPALLARIAAATGDEELAREADAADEEDDSEMVDVLVAFARTIERRVEERLRRSEVEA